LKFKETLHTNSDFFNFMFFVEKHLQWCDGFFFTFE
jgi:hypothetical protein